MLELYLLLSSEVGELEDGSWDFLQDGSTYGCSWQRRSAKDSERFNLGDGLAQ